jgi:hypothetical protein
MPLRVWQILQVIQVSGVRQSIQIDNVNIWLYAQQEMDKI